MQEKDVFTVDGFFFKTTKDAEEARAEKKKIDYLEKNLDFNDSKTLLAVYKKMAEGENFRTPIGWQYMTYLREQLIKAGILEADIPVVKISLQLIRPVEKKKPAKEDYRITGFRIAVAISIIMTILVLVLFNITLSSDNANALNYERVITNKYSSWEQELTERENVLREQQAQMEENTD